MGRIEPNFTGLVFGGPKMYKSLSPGARLSLPLLVLGCAMVSAFKHLHVHPSSNSKPPKIPTTSSTISSASSSTSTVSAITTSQQNLALSRATHISRPELLKRRSHCLKQLSRCYRDLYWALMEDLKTQYRLYYWDYGISPFKQPNFEVEGSGENITSNVRTDLDVFNNINNQIQNQRCAFVGCKLKAMPLTCFCHLHILSDSRQLLYKPCNYVIKSAQAGPITCGKPILRSTVPSLCTVHLQKAQKHLTRTLKRAGLNISSTSKMAPKFHVIVTEYVHHIQVKRREELSVNNSKKLIQEEKDS